MYEVKACFRNCTGIQKKLKNLDLFQKRSKTVETKYDLMVAKDGNTSCPSIFWPFLFTTHTEQQFIVPPPHTP